ncbi:MAG TPA: chitobiase/beta-hexosaminidase C-terminal domain-containing protein [Acidobacteriaceae bacterium]
MRKSTGPSFRTNRHHVSRPPLTTGFPATSTPNAGLFFLSAVACIWIAGCSGGSSAPTPTPTPPVAAAPSFTPAAGTYTSAESVTLADSTPGATIYYSTDGSTPTSASKVYSGAISVASTTTIEAIAAASGYTTSGVSSAVYTINLAAAGPTFTPAAGIYASAQSVTLADSTPGATIYYTTDGSTPTPSSKVYSSAISVAATTTINAMATASGYSASAISSAVYTINLAVAAPTFTPAAGTYTSAQSVALADSTAGATIYYTTDGSMPTTSSRVYSAAIPVAATTTINAIATASGYSTSQESSAVYTINLAAAAPTFTPAAGTYTSAQSVTLADSTAGATIYYTTDGTLPTTSSHVYSVAIPVAATTTINAIATASGYSTSAEGSAVYTITLPASTPTFAPAPGIFTSAQSVTLADSTAGATIYYTTDGTVPTTSSRVYSAAIPVAATTTINAIATASGYSTSAVSVGLYDIELPAAPTPAISPAGGTFATAQTVTLSDSAPGATIYYTTNGSTPTTASTKYTAPFTVSAPGTTIVNAIAVVAGVPNSNVAMVTFNLPAASSPNYTYTNVQIVGGGFVDGLYFHPAAQGLMYARTDVGGAYRWNDVPGGDTQWVPLQDFVGRFDSGFNLGVESLALDPNDPTRLYLAVGEYTESYGTNGYILASSDMGHTFTAVALPFKNGSNDNGRFAGERLSVDPANGRHIYFGTRLNGLYESNDQAVSFNKVAAFPVTGSTGTTADPGVGIIFEDFLTTSGMANGNTKTIYYGVSDPKIGLYVSNDGGQTFSTVPGQPTGYYPNASAFDPGNRYMYISYDLQTGCSSGCSSVGPGNVNAGQIWRYTLPTGSVPNGVWTNITPPTTGNGGYGYSSIAVDAHHPDTVMTTTLNKYYPPPYDDVFRSLDDGTTWVNYGTNIRRDSSLSPWVNFGQATPDGGNWLNHLVVDPFNSDHVMYGDGQTIWQTTDATAVDGVSTTKTVVTAGNSTNWSIGAVGVEEAVILGLASPPSGPAHLLSVMYDLGGFTHTTLTQSLNAQQNPQLTNATSVDYAGQAPLNVSRVGSNSAALGSGGAVQLEAFSSDGGITWTPSSSVPINPSTGKAITTGNGTIAVAADASDLVWMPSDVGTPANYSTDHGATWHAATGAPAQVSSNAITVAADRVNPLKFYLFSGSSSGVATIYISVDGGKSFTVASQLSNQYDLGLFVSPAAEGDLWTTSYNGTNHSTDSGSTFTPVLSYPNVVYAMGFGAAAAGASYPAIYIVGTLNGDTGCVSANDVADGFATSTNCIYRSVDEGKTFVRINDFDHQYSNANMIVGDPRVFGRFYLGTPGRGIIEGDSPN